MAYGRRTRRAGYRRRKSGSRTLSARNVYLRKSATSQAKQIHALNRKINRVYNIARPEIKVSYLDGYRTEFSNSTGSNTANVRAMFNAQPSMGVADNGRIGDTIYAKTLSYRFNIQYGVASSSSSEQQFLLTCHGCSCRLIILQAKLPNQSAPGITNILSVTSAQSDTANYNLLANCHLADGVTENWAVLWDKIYVMSTNRPELNKKIRVPLTYRKWRYTDTPVGGEPGTSYNNHACYAMWVVSGLDWNSFFSEKCVISQTAKLAYTDA